MVVSDAAEGEIAKAAAIGGGAGLHITFAHGNKRIKIKKFITHKLLVLQHSARALVCSRKCTKVSYFPSSSYISF